MAAVESAGTRENRGGVFNQQTIAEIDMAGITLAEAEARLAEYLAAEQAVLSGQTYTIGDKTLTLAHISSIQKGIEIWDRRVRRLSSGGITVRGATPV